MKFQCHWRMAKWRALRNTCWSIPSGDFTPVRYYVRSTSRVGLHYLPFGIASVTALPLAAWTVCMITCFGCFLFFVWINSSSSCLFTWLQNGYKLQECLNEDAYPERLSLRNQNRSQQEPNRGQGICTKRQSSTF